MHFLPGVQLSNILPSSLAMCTTYSSARCMTAVLSPTDTDPAGPRDPLVHIFIAASSEMLCFGPAHARSVFSFGCFHDRRPRFLGMNGTICSFFLVASIIADCTLLGMSVMLSLARPTALRPFPGPGRRENRILLLAAYCLPLALSLLMIFCVRRPPYWVAGLSTPSQVIYSTPTHYSLCTML